MSTQSWQIVSPLWLVAGALLIGAAFFWRTAGNQNGWHRVMHDAVLFWLTERNPGSHRFSPSLLAAGLVAIGLAAPSIPGEDNQALRHAQGWLILVDVSRSMGLTDIAPSRLAASRDLAQTLVQAAGSRPVALILFAGDAYLAGPMSYDKQHTLAFLSALKPDIVPVPGSNLNRALALAGSAIEQSEMLSARVFLLTDATGSTDPAWAPAAAIARAGHRLDVIVTGSSNATEHPSDTEFAQRLAQSGGGMMIQSDASGQIDATDLQLTRPPWEDQSFLASTMMTLSWQNLSHWILLAVLPLLLLMFWRRQV